LIAPLTRRYRNDELESVAEVRELIEEARRVSSLTEQDLVREVSDAFVDTGELLNACLHPGNLHDWPGARIVVVDLGVKRNILRSLRSRGVELCVVLLDVRTEQIISLRTHGGDLTNCQYD